MATLILPTLEVPERDLVPDAIRWMQAWARPYHRFCVFVSQRSSLAMMEAVGLAGLKVPLWCMKVEPRKPLTPETLTAAVDHINTWPIKARQRVLLDGESALRKAVEVGAENVWDKAVTSWDRLKIRSCERLIWYPPPIDRDAAIAAAKTFIYRCVGSVLPQCKEAVNFELRGPWSHDSTPAKGKCGIAYFYGKNDWSTSDIYVYGFKTVTASARKLGMDMLLIYPGRVRFEAMGKAISLDRKSK